MRTWGLHWDWSRISLVGRYARSPLNGPRTLAHGPSLQGRKTRLTDGFPVTRLVLFEQSVAHQKPNAAFAAFNRCGLRIS